MDELERETLVAIFQEPVPTTIEWEAIEDLFEAIGCAVVDDDGERITFELRGAIGSFERPPIRQMARRYTVLAARDYLTRLGVTP
ncbi:MAG TPA: hypothetical protein VKQ09_05895 [Sphingomonas sp.]|nr:hypothetical protein [Sphingomonas sp.]